MSKDDFRDRLKSYSVQPEHGDWVKMQQLLDADKEDRPAIAWWRFGGLFALLLIPASLWLMNGSFTQAETNTNAVNFETATNTLDHKTNLETKEKTNAADLSTTNNIEKSSSINDGNTQLNRSTIENTFQEEKRNSTKSNAVKENLKKTINKTTKRKTSSQSKSIFTEPMAETVPSSSKSEQLSKTTSVPKSIELPKDKDLIANLSMLDKMNPEIFNLADRELPTLVHSSFVKVYPKQKTNSWYGVTGIGGKYPIVDISNASAGALVPAQKFFPSYLVELGVGKRIGKMAIEVGTSASLYQYKLGRALEEADVLVIAESQENTSYVVNKFAVISPYLRGQYSFNLKRNFILGLHSLVSLNRKIELSDQYISNQWATQTSSFEIQNSRFGEDRQLSLNYDLGFSLEKLFAKHGRIAMDFSYTFTSGILEEGSYSVLRDSSVESNGSYALSGVGPMVKFRYYLGSNK